MAIAKSACLLELAAHCLNPSAARLPFDGAAAMGMLLIERLRAAGMTFRVEGAGGAANGH